MPRHIPQITPGITGLVAVGGTAGAGIRWLILTVGPSTTFPWSVLVVNLVGCAILGVLVGRGVQHNARLLLGTGFCGGLTTFSTFTVEAAQLMRADHLGMATTYLAASLLGGLLCFDRARAMTTGAVA
ncbi:MAG: CrcB family protein [Actinobacteria bacterium]|jgi:CrcB protein|nr:CrcB family protein [Actinomycetota bacterium]MBT3688488.1 CrcB family protein [Actinomycetota bacterium]MBT4038064.1 CrcB family protein [Actinomycetota bacterium]MBT4279891.1 CrcB family protein [Actinomycetota bacterium]MBT4343057.1 CrcB family protein [Actinomycetota bacterium]